MFRVLGLFVCVLLLASSIYAQKRRGKTKPVSFQKHYNEILPKEPQFKKSGWILAPGATFMLTPFVSRKKTYDESMPTEYEVKTRGLGRFGLYAEVGRYQMLPYWKIFKYMDYGISYKGLRGSESSENLTTLATADGSFGYHYAEAFINFNHIWRVGKYNFVQHSLGANAGYGFITNKPGTTIAPENMDPGNFLGQLHYKLGYGIKMRGNWILIPAIETPVLNLLPFEPPRSALGFYGSRYRPLIFSLRFLFMRPANTLDCTPVKTRDGWKMPTDMDKQQEMNDSTK